MNLKPLPPEVLANSAQDRVQPASGRLKASRPVQRYGSRRPGTNPRTGEKLVPWEAVQVLDPELPTWTPVFEEVMVATEDGCRPQNFRVFVQGFITGEQLQVAVADVARSFGFTVVRT